MKTDNAKLDSSQNAVANYLVKPFNADNGPLIMVRQLTPGKVTYEYIIAIPFVYFVDNQYSLSLC